MTAFAAALDALFADAHLACDVVYTAEGEPRRWSAPSCAGRTM